MMLRRSVVVEGKVTWLTKQEVRMGGSERLVRDKACEGVKGGKVVTVLLRLGKNPLPWSTFPTLLPSVDIRRSVDLRGS